MTVYLVICDASAFDTGECVAVHATLEGAEADAEARDYTCRVDAVDVLEP